MVDTDIEQALKQDNNIKHLHAILHEFSNVMMIVSHTGEVRTARARPMAIARLDEDCTLYFLTSEDTVKVEAITKDSEGMCTGQSKTQHVGLVGQFDVVNNRALINELWSTGAAVWFPRGKEDPAIRVVVFRPRTAEFWDMAGAKGVSALFDMAKSLLTNTSPKANHDSHATVQVSKH
jgi:general stress protein 26